MHDRKEVRRRGRDAGKNRSDEFLLGEPEKCVLTDDLGQGCAERNSVETDRRRRMGRKDQGAARQR